MIMTIIGTTLLPWIQDQIFQKFQNAPKLMKLNIIVDWQVWMRLLTLEFPKWPPLPWKLQKSQNSQNALNLIKLDIIVN